LFFKQQTEGDESWWGISDEIQDVLDQIKFFGVDFDTSNMDEQLNALIVRMMSFVDTLDPDSPAYQAAMTALEGFKAQFEAMGGKIDVEAGINFIAGGAEDPMAKLQALIDSLKNEKIGIDLDIAAAEAELQAISDQLLALELLKPQIDLNIAAAEARIAELEKMLLEMDLTLYVSILGDPNAGGNYHSGGLVEAHQGMLASDELMAVLKRGEYVHPDYQVAKYPEADWEQFRVTGDPGVFERGEQRQPNIVVQPKIVVNDANKWTYVQVTDDHIYDRVNYRQRKMETNGNPWA
jgi:hypothetical protein